MHSVSKEFKFSAAHILPQHEGKCKRLHGHNYKIVVYAHSAGLDEQSMVLDFGILKQAVQQVVEFWDHRFIVAKRYVDTVRSDDAILFIKPWGWFSVPREMCIVLDIPESTAEMLAWYIGNELCGGTQWNESFMFYRVEVWETDESMGCWEGGALK